MVAANKRRDQPDATRARDRGAGDHYRRRARAQDVIKAAELIKNMMKMGQMVTINQSA